METMTKARKQPSPHHWFFCSQFVFIRDYSWPKRFRCACFLPAWVSLASVFLLSSTLFAQSFNAAVTGRVLDPGNAIIGGAEVTVINTETKVRYTGRTNEYGIYLVSDIQPGTYLVQISKP